VTDSGVTDAEWLAGVPAVAAQHGLPLRRLGLDVTEQALANAPPEALTALRALTAEGLYLTVDDFATGFTRIGPVIRLGARAIEFDRQFVATLPDPHSGAVARAMVAMAEALELTVVAEGVEDEATLAMVRALGCTQARGYLLGRPEPAEALTG
jgi:EAL domain-containing protein (putative c-di-GMP-specific phosphodiesterase class I)